ncbi:MAG: hypothetical protein AAF430_18460 [Myxococcota bacterium]
MRSMLGGALRHQNSSNETAGTASSRVTLANAEIAPAAIAKPMLPDNRNLVASIRFISGSAEQAFSCRGTFAAVG